jgi:hypothetical protein
MSANPYAPPTTRVADIESAQDSAAKPVQVKTAVPLLWLTLGVGLIRSATVLQRLHLQGYALLGVTLACFIVVSLVGLWTYRISRGGRWARLTYGLMVTAGVLGYLLGSPPTLHLNFLLLAFQTVLQVSAVVLLFTPPANRWFRGRSVVG